MADEPTTNRREPVVVGPRVRPAPRRPRRIRSPRCGSKPRRRSRPSPSRPSSPSSRHRGGQPHRALVGWISFAAALLAGSARWPAAWPCSSSSNGDANAQEARDQRFVDTATPDGGQHVQLQAGQHRREREPFLQRHQRTAARDVGRQQQHREPQGAYSAPPTRRRKRSSTAPRSRASTPSPTTRPCLFRCGSRSPTSTA